MSCRRAVVAVVALVALAALPAAAAPRLRVQLEVNGDFALIGNTLGYDCNPAVPAPLVGAVGACGTATEDTASDVYWRSNASASGDAPGAAFADVSITPAQARSSARLRLPPGATIKYARIYWGALAPNPWTVGPEITLERPGVAGSATVLAADRLSSATAANGALYYQGTAEVTALVSAWAEGDYQVSGITAPEIANLDSEHPYAAWALVVFYEDVSEPLRSLTLFDGFELVTKYAQTADVSISGFRVPDAAFDAKLGVVVYEGDQRTDGDSLLFNGAALSDASNPAINFFNGTRTYLGLPVSSADPALPPWWSNAGDLPRLTGAADSMAGLDLDVVDVTASVRGGDTSASATLTTSDDTFALGAVITSITTLHPDFGGHLEKTWRDLDGDGAVLPGDVIEYRLTATNAGNDAAVGTVIVDPLPPGVTFVAGSIQTAWTGAPELAPSTDAAGDDVAEYDAASRTVTARVGRGASATQGGALGAAVVAPATAAEWARVVFRVRVDPAVAGQIVNLATIRAAGEHGAAAATAISVAPAGPPGFTVDACATDLDCSASAPRCAPGSPRTCVGCLADADCGGATPVCDTAGQACRGGPKLEPAALERAAVAGVPVPFGHGLSTWKLGGEVVPLAVLASGCAPRVELARDAGGAPGEVIAVDTTGDGVFETVAHDEDGDGKPDLGLATYGTTVPFFVTVRVPADAAIGSTCTVTVTAGAGAGLVSAVDVVRVSPAITFGPDDTFAAGRGRVVPSGGRALFRGVVQNNGSAPADVALAVQLTATPARDLAPAVVYTDPDGDGDPRDGRVVQSLAAIPPFGGRANVVVALSATSPIGTPLATGARIHAEAVATSGGASATKLAEAQVGVLTACADAACTVPAARFAPCEPATVRAEGLVPGATGYALRWYAGTVTPTASTVPSRSVDAWAVGGDGSATDTLPLAADATAWTVALVDTRGGAPVIVETLSLQVERDGNVTVSPDGPPYVGGNPFHAAARVENRATQATLRATRLRWTVRDPAGREMAPSGAFGAGVGPTRMRVGLDVPAGKTADDALAVAAAGFGGIGRYAVTAEWLLSCADAPIATSTASLDVPPPPPTLTAPAAGAVLKDARPTFAGLATPGASVTVDVDGATLGPVEAGADGTFALVPAADLPGGDRTARAIQTVNGAPSAASAAVAFKIDAGSSGCGCRTGGAGAGTALALLALAAAALAPRRRRRAWAAERDS
ncbi:MYXO-CTERM sorting domain-containing protein [Anaeromyxobacter oryzae]|uniref:DUF11 domain-containing protein n=1 Tax=Anaeromyxobacter oryzae TaxID=2918170 RepID=A0ABN6MTX2_9BACT|nr:MYXO-CTERM sorting domain-containing protein [Anaeromyxobacter oryzae]BDG04412.1 hypothetical protein AMOR_34080 [Anaeromyxobacter oryzae]